MDIVELVLLIVVLAYILMALFHILLKIKKVDKSQKYYFSGIALFLVGYFLCRLLLLSFELVYAASDEGYYVYVVASFFAALGLFGIMFVVEKYVYTKLHFMPSIIILICAILMLVFPMYNGTNLVTWYSVVSGLLAILIPFLYFIVGFKVSGKTRKKSFLLAIGIVILEVGNLINMGILRAAYPILIYIAPITIIIGLVIFHFALLIYQV